MTIELDVHELQDMIDEGYIRVRKHPELDLCILNYTEKCAYEKNWNPTTLMCRGLVIDGEYNIVARPWEKFFNYGEVGAADIQLGDLVHVTDKVDGSLGILIPGHDIVATRGSFESEQAIHATKLYQERYAGKWDRDPDITYLFEIVYPENRIVLDYGDQDDLVLLGGVDTDSGAQWTLDLLHEWTWRTTRDFGYMTLAVALAMPPRSNAEGIVVQSADDRLLKIKQEDYVRLHRIVTGLNERVVWEAMKDGNLNELLRSVPEEFHEWVEGKRANLASEYRAIAFCACETYESIWLPAIDRKVFAERAAKFNNRSLLFLLLDGNAEKFREAIWKQIKPRGDTYMKHVSEDEV